MMKAEFEQRIGKTIAWETWERYEAMYMAVDVDKDTFVAMLNVKAIPEDPRAIAARAEDEAIKKEKRAEVKRLSEEIKENEKQAAYYQQEAHLSIGVVSDTLINFYKINARECKNRADALRAERKTIKMLWGV